MSRHVDITLVANAGVLVSCNGVGLLVDGMHHEECHPFSKVAEGDLQRMQQGQAPFENLDYLLFTHEHPDHLTPRLVLEHVQRRAVQGVFLPDEEHGSPALGALLHVLWEQGIAHQTFSLEPGRSRRVGLAPGMTLTAIGTRHMGAQYNDVRHDSFLLSLGDINLLFTGDGDHVAAFYQDSLQGVSLDAVFVNPLFYHNDNGQQIIETVFRPRHVVIYHMPFSKDDTLNFTYMVGRDTAKHERSGIETHVLQEEGQQIRLHPRMQRVEA